MCVDEVWSILHALGLLSLDCSSRFGGSNSKMDQTSSTHMTAHDDREHVFICRISIILQVLIKLGRLLFRRHLYTGTEFMIDHWEILQMREYCALSSSSIMKFTLYEERTTMMKHHWSMVQCVVNIQNKKLSYGENFDMKKTMIDSSTFNWGWSSGTAGVCTIKTF